MRQQTVARKKRYVRDSARRDQRQQAVAFLHSGKNITQSFQFRKLSRAAFGRIKAALDNNNDGQLSKMLNPTRKRAGRKKVSYDEQD